MGIRIAASRLEEVLSQAMVVAESDADLPRIWLDHVTRISQCPSKTYIAALGTALLAKAAYPEVDALSVKNKAGPKAYSMRGVVKTLVRKAPVYGYHLGVTRAEPLNNQPWFGSDRVDRFENVHRDAIPYHRDMVRYLSELNGLGPVEAFQALAAFLRLRIEAGEQERDAANRVWVASSGRLDSLIEILTVFVRDDPEGGRRGQSLVAALFDIGHDEVSLASINSPSGFDVTVSDEGQTILGVEVKQKPVVEATALHLAEEAARRQVDKVLLVAIAATQQSLDRERIRRQAFAEHGVMTNVWESVAELVTEIALQTPIPARDFARMTPTAYLRRMREHGVAQSGLEHWSDLCNALLNGKDP